MQLFHTSKHTESEVVGIWLFCFIVFITTTDYYWSLLLFEPGCGLSACLVLTEEIITGRLRGRRGGAGILVSQFCFALPCTSTCRRIEQSAVPSSGLLTHAPALLPGLWGSLGRSAGLRASLAWEGWEAADFGSVISQLAGFFFAPPSPASGRWESRRMSAPAGTA